jgi:hypothetical protein
VIVPANAMQRVFVHIASLLIGAALASSAGVPALAASVGVGADYYTGPSGLSVRDILAYGETSFGRASRTTLTGVASRYSSSQTGPGTGATLAAGFPLSPTTSLQVVGSRSFGDEGGYRATRFQLGPVFPIGPGRSLGISYTRAYDSIGPSTKGLSVEAVLPATASLIALARGALASVNGGGTNLQGSAGALWSPAPRVILLGEVTLGRDATGIPGGGIAVAGPGSAPSRDYVSGPALLVGLRYVIH